MLTRLTTLARNLIQRYSPLENPAIPLTSPEAYSLFALPTASGVPVTYRECMGHPAVRRGVNLIAGYVARLPLHVFMESKDGSRKKDLRHPAYKLLMRQPASIMTPFVFRRQMMAYLLVYGNGYAWIDRDDNGDPKQLLILDPESTWVTMSPLNEPIYHTRMGHKTFQFAGEDVFHLKDFGDGVVGDGLVHIARDSLGLSLALQRHACAYFRNGAAGGRVIELSPMLKDKEKLDQFKSEWRKVNSGADNGYKDKFVPPGTKLVPDDSRADAKESQLLECLEQDLIRVANLLNIPPHKMGANISTSYSSLQSENQAFLDDCLDNWLTLWSQEIWVKLLREREKEDDTRTVDYDRSELLRMDPKTEGELRIAKLNNGVISWEECRLLEDLPPEKDEEQEWRHASNITIESDEEEEEEVPPVQQLPPPQQLQQQTEKPPEKDAEKTAEPEGAQDAGSGTDRSDDKAKAMSLQAVERWLTRVRKSVEGGKKDVGAHKEVFMDHLGVWDKAEEVADGLISRMQAEIDAVLPEQVAEVFGRLDADKIAEGLWTTS